MPNGPREKRKDSVEIPKRVKYNEKLANEIVELIRTGEGEENFVGDSEIIALGGASNETKDRPLG